MSPPSLVELSYSAAVRALDLQERTVEQLRDRTGTLLAAASLTASFCGTQTLQHRGSLGALGMLALVALAASVAGCLYVLLPEPALVFTLRAPAMYERLHVVCDDEEVHRLLIYWLERYWTSNQAIIDGLGRSFVLAALALTTQLVLWCVALADTVA